MSARPPAQRGSLSRRPTIWIAVACGLLLLLGPTAIGDGPAVPQPSATAQPQAASLPEASLPSTVGGLSAPVDMTSPVAPVSDATAETRQSPVAGAPRGAVHDVVLGAYYRTAAFYGNRKPPSLKWIVAFLRSAHRHRLRADGTEIRVVLFVDSTSQRDLLARLGAEAYAVSSVDVDGHFGSTDATDEAVPSAFLTLVAVSNATHGSLLRHRWASGIGNGANNFRFALFGDWVRRHRRGIRGVMMSDVTDVVFQANPFDACVPPAAGAASQGGGDGDDVGHVVFTMESRRHTFKNEKYNRRWFSCFGDDALRSAADARAPISCAGVTFADAPGAIEYTAAQLALIAQPDLVECAASVIRAALDQATHNYLQVAEKGAVSMARRGLRSTRFRVSRAWTEGGASPGGATSATCTFHGNFGKPRMSAEGLVVDADGRPFAVVHQYTSDRHPPVMRAVEAAYRLGEP